MNYADSGMALDHGLLSDSVDQILSSFGYDTSLFVEGDDAKYNLEKDYQQIFELEDVERDYWTAPAWNDKNDPFLKCEDGWQNFWLEPSLNKNDPFLNGNVSPDGGSKWMEQTIEIPDPLPYAYSVLISPRTCQPLTAAELEYLQESTELPVEILEAINPKPYHWTLDHNYPRSPSSSSEEGLKEENKKTKENMRQEKVVKVEEMIDLIKHEGEPVVDVWEIENFNEKQVPTEKPLKAKRIPLHRRRDFEFETRRSTRTAEKQQREQARKISNALNVHALKIGQQKTRNVRRYKNIKPKNSVETTPSQSDIEEWYSQPVRPTYTKLTKKKTSKGRIDHSESERHRREVLRSNFDNLCSLIPRHYMIGEKLSSQISKQKILNGAKIYILALRAAKRSYRQKCRRNSFLFEKCKKKLNQKLFKSVKKHK